MKKSIAPFFLLACVAASSAFGDPGAPAADRFTAYVEQSGAVPCSPDPAVNCELSCVAWVKHGGDSHLIFGNDKPPKSGAESSAFAIPYSGKRFNANTPHRAFNFPPFSTSNKIESMSVTQDGRFVVAMTAFDRFNEADSGQDKFDVMIAWAADAPQKAKVVAASERNGVVSSLALRGRLTHAIQKKFGVATTYFKVEGMALMPNRRILFGVREVGESYVKFDYRVLLIEGGYRIDNGELHLDDAIELNIVRDFTELESQVGRKIGVSSIEYDWHNKRLYVMTSFEDDKEKRLGAYLWVLPDEHGLGTRPVLVTTADGAPFEFPHKAEGMAVLGNGRVFIVHDDDREITNVRLGGRNGGQMRARRLNEAPFDIVHICSDRDSSPNCLPTQ